MREKWDKIHYSDGSTYGGKTIERAIDRTTDHYQPSSHTDATVTKDGESEYNADDTSDARSSPSGQHSIGRLSDRISAIESTLEHMESAVTSLEEDVESLRSDLTEERTKRIDSERAGDGQKDSPVWFKLFL